MGRAYRRCARADSIRLTDGEAGTRGARRPGGDHRSSSPRPAAAGRRIRARGPQTLPRPRTMQSGAAPPSRHGRVRAYRSMTPSRAAAGSDSYDPPTRTQTWLNVAPSVLWSTTRRSRKSPKQPRPHLPAVAEYDPSTDEPRPCRSRKSLHRSWIPSPAEAEFGINAGTTQTLPRKVHIPSPVDAVPCRRRIRVLRPCHPTWPRAGGQTHVAAPGARPGGATRYTSAIPSVRSWRPR